MPRTRTENSARNFAITMTAYGCNFALQLVNRIVFVRLLSEEYLGLSGLFSNIMLMLAIVDLGLGEAMVYTLYKPLAEHNEEKIKSLLSLSQRLFSLIGFTVLLVGGALTPFLQIFIHDMPAIPLIRVYYLLYLLETVVPYFFCSKRFLIFCDQKMYISSISNLIKKMLTAVVQIAILLLTRNFLLFLIVQVILTLAENRVIVKIADKLYPYIKSKIIEPLDKKEERAIKRNVYAASFHKIGNTVLNSSDNIILSTYIGLSAVGLYSNYALIVTTLQTFISGLFSAVAASVGNLAASKEEGTDQESIFARLLLANFFIVMFCTTCLFSLLNPFIRICYGDKYLLSIAAVASFVGAFYLIGMRRTVTTFRDAAGLFWYDRYKAVIECALNIAISIPLTIRLGIAGTFLGTIISLLLVSCWVEPYVFFKHYFHKSMIPYLLKQLLYALLTVCTCVLAAWLGSLIPDESIIGFIFRMLISAAVTISVFAAAFFRTSEFAYFYRQTKGFLRKKM